MRRRPTVRPPVVLLPYQSLVGGSWLRGSPTPHMVKVVRTQLEPTGPTSEGVWHHHFLHSCSQQSFTELVRIVMRGSGQASLHKYLQPLRSPEGSPPLPLLLAPVYKRNEEMPKLGFK